LLGDGDHGCASCLLRSLAVGLRQGEVPVEGKTDVGRVEDAMAGSGGDEEEDGLRGGGEVGFLFLF
jgi:hypothetical protein